MIMEHVIAHPRFKIPHALSSTHWLPSVATLLPRGKYLPLPSGICGSGQPLHFSLPLAPPLISHLCPSPPWTSRRLAVLASSSVSNRRPVLVFVTPRIDLSHRRLPGAPRHRSSPLHPPSTPSNFGEPERPRAHCLPLRAHGECGHHLQLPASQPSRRSSCHH